MIKEVEEYIVNALKLLPNVGEKLPAVEAEQRACTMLKVQAYLVFHKAELVGNKIRVESLKAAVYKKLFDTITVKATVTEKSIHIEANPEYQIEREKFDELEKDIKSLNTLIDIFGNGHVTLRQMGKGDN